MRVLEPHHFKQPRPKHKRPLNRRRFLVYGGSLFSIVAALYVAFGQNINYDQSQQNQQANETQTVDVKPAVLKEFTAEEFKNAYSSHRYPNTQAINEQPEITGNEVADQRLRNIAERRGYKLTSLPVSSIVKTGEPGLEGDDLIQPNALIAWQELKEASLKDGIKLRLSSAYRSIDYQRSLFLRRLQGVGVNVERILEGFADDEVDAVLSRAAPPGYSRHHTGYTIDLSCNGVGLDAFRNTDCYAWLSRNNSENAKKYGWVPSYPEGVGDVGPEPEPWEFIWISTRATFE